jgi:molybdopterin converting factor subunit 1
MTIEVLLFASLKDAAHADRVNVQLPEAITVADLLHATGEQFPALSRHLPHCRVAVNREYARNDQPVREGDEIALLPPVSGG